MNTSMTREHILQQHWDAIVIGTGIGGGTIGYALAKGGKKVLFIEKGQSSLSTAYSTESSDNNTIAGDYAENIKADKNQNQDAIMRACGRTTDALVDTFNNPNETFTPLLGAGTGGSSALYGMTMERLFPEDFTPKQFLPNSPEANLPEQWPVSFAELQEFYTQAETLYQVKASPDPQRPQSETRGISSPPPLSPANQELADHLKSKDLNLYYQAMACQYKPNCRECIGFLCAKRCKGDSGLHCVEPAIQQYGAQILLACEVSKLHEDSGSITHIDCTQDGQAFTLKSPLIILAAGAIHTPALLLSSKNADNPNGLANGSDMVGRNFMRHYYEYFFVATKTKVQPGDLQKQLSFNDFYLHEGEKMGTVQSFGPLLPASIVVKQIINGIRRHSKLIARLATLMTPVLEVFIDKLFAGRLAICAILEDLPYPENRITLSEQGNIQIFDRIHPSDEQRLKKFRSLLKNALRPYKYIHTSAAANVQILGHQCGTCRFGESPSDSVLNKFNRCHEIDNLYVVDASFFPSSGGTNPSLTIAANALRVAKHLLESPAK